MSKSWCVYLILYLTEFIFPCSSCQPIRLPASPFAHLLSIWWNLSPSYRILLLPHSCYIVFCWNEAGTVVVEGGSGWTIDPVHSCYIQLCRLHDIVCLWLAFLFKLLVGWRDWNGHCWCWWPRFAWILVSVVWWCRVVFVAIEISMDKRLWLKWLLL